MTYDTTINALMFLFLAALPCSAQHPEIFDVSTVVIGSQRLETLQTYAQGKWSDAGPDVAIDSTEINCYKRFGFCEVASALHFLGLASVSLSHYDILRWDTDELIAVDTSATCVVNSLRFDFAAKKVSISSASKGEGGVCQNITTPGTAFLTGITDELARQKQTIDKRKTK